MVNPDGLEIDALHSNFRLDMFAAGPRPLWRWLKDDQLYCFAATLRYHQQGAFI